MIYVYDQIKRLQTILHTKQLYNNNKKSDKITYVVCIYQMYDLDCLIK